MLEYFSSNRGEKQKAKQQTKNTTKHPINMFLKIIKDSFKKLEIHTLNLFTMSLNIW